MPIFANSIQIRESVADAMKAQIVPFIKGSPGIGKSAVIKALAADYGLKLIDVRLAQCDPCDLLGFPDIDRKTGKASYVPMDLFPLEGDPIPKGYNGWLLFLDEVNSADKAVQKASYKLMLDRMVGNQPLHKKVAIAAAGNLDTDNALVEEMSTALQSRLIHFYMQVDHETWLDWAMANGVHYYITDHIKQFPDKLYTFKPDHMDDTYGSPRTWEFASRFLHQRGNNLDDHILRLNLAGTLSEGLAREFLGACKVYGRLPKREEIIRSPKTAPLPEERSLIWAMTGSLANWAKESVIEPIMDYTSRLPMEFQVICLREMVRRVPEVKKTKPVEEWLIKNAANLY